MGLPLSGPLSLKAIADEVYQTNVTGPISLGQSSIEAGFSTPHAMSEFYGYIGVNPNITTGRFLIGGTFAGSKYDPQGAGGLITETYTSSNAIAINSIGKKSSAFVGSGFTNGAVLDSVVYDGVIYMVGSFTTHNSVTQNRVMAIDLSTGLKKASWNSGTGFNSVAYSIKVSDLGLVIVGAFTTYKGITSNRLIKLDFNGNKVTSFVIGRTGLNTTTYCTSVDSNGDLLIGGNFTSYKGSGGKTRIIKMSASGTYNSSFVIGTGFNSYPLAMKHQPDGKLIVVGNFTTYKGVSRNRIVRLNPNGDYDTTFSIGTGFNGIAKTIEILPDGSILVGGDFTSYDTFTNVFSIVKLSASGELDGNFVGTAKVFTSGAFTKGIVNSIVRNPNHVDQILVGGSFTYFNDGIYNSFKNIASMQESGLESNNKYENKFYGTFPTTGNVIDHINFIDSDNN